VNGRASLTPFGLWGRTCRTVLNEIRRVLIVLSKLVVNGAFPPMPDYSRSYEKQYKGRGPQGDEAHHTTHHKITGTIAPKALRFRLRLSTSRYFKLDADGNDLHQPLGSPFPYFCVSLPVSTG
jgi:hypothetical protein